MIKLCPICFFQILKIFFQNTFIEITIKKFLFVFERSDKQNYINFF